MARESDASTPRSARLTETIARCEAALEGIAPDRVQALRARLRRARTVLDCWNLRRALFDLIAQTFGPEEARTRLAELHHWFESRRSR